MLFNHEDWRFWLVKEKLSISICQILKAFAMDQKREIATESKVSLVAQLR